MRYADLYLRQPDEMLHPMQRFIRRTDAVRYEELQAWNVHPATRTEYALFYVEGDRDRYDAAIDAVDSVRRYDLTPIDDRSFYAYVRQETREADRRWRDAFAARGLVIVPPIVYDDDAAFYVTVGGDADDLRTLLEELPDSIDTAVEAVGEYDRRHGAVAGELTDRQLEAVAVAAAVGFYDVPREASVREVADELGCAASTASNHLRKAEAAVMTRLVDRYAHAPSD